jgi:soluble lytic murein transglycosylase
MKRPKFDGCEDRNQARFPEGEGCHRGTHRPTLVWLLASALAVLGTAEAMSAARHKSESSDRKNAAEAEHHKPESPDRKKDKKAAEAERHKKAAEVVHHRHVIHPPAGDGPAAPLSPDLAAAKQAIELVRQGKAKDATALAASIGDPVAAKLVEWARLRHSDSEAGFDRYVAFIRANPDWPSMQLLRRRAETRLWQERRDGAAVHRFVGDNPTSAIGRLALARAEMGEGDRARAEKEIRAVWQSASLSAETEAAVLAAFPDVLTRADHVARMDRRIGAKDFGAAMRAAKHVGEDHVAIVKACTAAEAKSANGGALLDAVHADARGSGLRIVPCALAVTQRRAVSSRPHRDAEGEHCGRGQADAGRVAGGFAAPGH